MECDLGCVSQDLLRASPSYIPLRTSTDLVLYSSVNFASESIRESLDFGGLETGNATHLGEFDSTDTTRAPDDFPVQQSLLCSKRLEWTLRCDSRMTSSNVDTAYCSLDRKIN